MPRHVAGAASSPPSTCRTVAAVLLSAACLAGGCGTGGGTADRTVRPTTTTAPPRDVAAIAADLNAYWAAHDEGLGFSYTPVPADRIGTPGDGLVCDGAPVGRGEVAGNAFVDPDCREGPLVAYDPADLGASLVRAEATIAHEWGHVVQAQARDLDLSEDPDGLPIDAELQADCFAGAWAAERAVSALPDLRRDTRGAGDPGDVDIEDPDAHGTPRERATAFDVGVRGGPAACVDELLDALP